MAKQRRPTTRATASKSGAGPKRPVAGAALSASKIRRSRKITTPVVKVREAYVKAIGLYENGLKAMRRRHFDRAATSFGKLLEQFPEERDLLERARLYLRVCERESGPSKKAPRTVNERILAATLALNRHDAEGALALLRSAAVAHPDNDYIQYMLALGHALRNDADSAAQHLIEAIKLNPENRLQANQEPDFDAIRKAQPFLDAIKVQ
jgi:tetratricopeptide (TPR) repeat protein